MIMLITLLVLTFLTLSFSSSIGQLILWIFWNCTFSTCLILLGLQKPDSPVSETKQNKTRFDTLFLMNHTDNISHLRGRSKTVCFAAHSPSSASILVHIYPHIPAMTGFASHFSSDLTVARVSWPLWGKRAELSLFLHWTVIGFRLLGISVLREAGQGIPVAVGGSLEKG